MPLPTSQALVARAQLVPYAAYGMNQAFSRTMIDLAAQVIYIDINHVGRRIERQVPYVLDDHGAADSPAGIQHQVFEQGELLRS